MNHQGAPGALSDGAEFTDGFSEQKVERLQVLYHLIQAFSRAPGLAEIYEASLRGLERALSTDRAAILLYDADHVMRFRAWHGLSDQYRAAVEGHSPWRRDATDPQPLPIADVMLDETLAPYRSLFASEGIGALAFIPLLSRNRLIGKLMVYFSRPHVFQPEEVSLAQAVAGHVAFAVDRKRSEEKLALYREIFAHSSEAIAIIDTHGRYVEQNAAHRALMGYEDRELSGMTPALHLGEERFAEVAAILGAHGVYRSDVTSTTKSGSRRDIELSAFTVRDDAGDAVCYVGVKRDISERKRMEGALHFLAGASAALDRSLDFNATVEELAKLTVPFLGDWVLIELLDESGALHPAVSVHGDPKRSPSLARLMELRAGAGWASLARRAVDTMKSIRLRRAADALAAEFGGSASAPLLRAVGSGSAIALPLRARGRVLGVMTLVSDTRSYDDRNVSLVEELARRGATALDNARLYREAQDSDRRKEEFLAVLAHELRNPMTPLLTCLELMRVDGTDAASIGRWREIMERQVRNLTRLVDDLLDVSRITRGKIELKKETVELATIVGRAIETTRPLLESRRLAISVDVDDGVWLVADPLRLEQVLANLLNNAAKYTPESGQVEVRGTREVDWILIRVRDNGVGIAPDMLSRVFDPFLQCGRASGGLGIGLTLVRNLVELHGGSVRASSNGPGEGSEFIVRLPLGAPRAEEPSLSADASEPREPGPPRRTLIVDDNVDGATVLAEALRLRGHEVHVAHDGQSALQQAARHAPDLVLLDLALPDLDGYEVASRLRYEPGLAETKLIAVSGYGQEQYRKLSEAAGFTCHLVKPIDLNQLDAILASLPDDRDGKVRAAP